MAPLQHTSGLAAQQVARATSLDSLRQMRSEARREIDRLIQFLDRSDPYVMTELEDEDEREDIGEAEPSLGSFDRMLNQEKSYRQRGLRVCPEVDAEQEDSDAEPSLGSCTGWWGGEPDNQENWARGTRDDLEDEHDGREGEREDHEPSLGATEHFNQTLWAACDREDRECNGPATSELSA